MSLPGRMRFVVPAFLIASMCVPWMATGARAASPTQGESAPANEPALFDLPDGFALQMIASGITGATGTAIAPDGRVFICEQTGALRVVANDALQPDPFLTVEVDSQWERGLLGVALDPAFPRTPFVYVCYVSPKPYPHHRISRFTAKGDRALAGSEVVLFEGDDQTKLGGAIPAGHQGGGIQFGGDGKLYVAIGEQTAGAPSQRLDTLQGKLLRINPDGSVPDDNPFLRTTKGKYRAIWAYGLRNPFGIAVQPGTGRLYINDVGDSRWEEVNEGIAGANYGWPLSEGPTTSPGQRAPILAYGEAPKKSISAGVFYNPLRSQFPESFVGKYFFADYMLNWIRTLDPEHPDSVASFASGLSGPVALQVGPDGSLYCLERNAWVKDGEFRPGTGALQRIVYGGRAGPGVPSLTTQPDDIVTIAGARARFRIKADGSGPLRFQWRRDGRQIPGADAASYTIESASDADDGARFECVVSNPRGRLKSRAATLWLEPLRQPAKALPMVSGLEYEAHQGRWPGLPAFEAGSRTKTGTAVAFDVGLRPRDEEFGLTFRGFLEVDRPGAYTFHLEGSGAGKLYVAAAEVAAIAMRTGPRHASGTVGLAPGRHAIRFDFAHGRGRPHLALMYSGPDLDMRPIPAEKLFRVDHTRPVAAEIRPDGGHFSGPVLVTLATPSRFGSIRYTLDGKTPTLESPRADGALLIDHTTTLTAGVFEEARTAPVAVSRATFDIHGKAPYGLSERPLASTVMVARRAEDMPRLLSETGLFRSLEDLTPQPGVIPYDVNSPLWSDGARKLRWIVLPGDGRIRFAPTGPWKFPAGTVFVKHFELGEDGDPRVEMRRLETRLLVVDRAGQGFGVTYRWRADQRDAELLSDGRTEEIRRETSDGARSQSWTYPSRADCLICHTPQAGFVLGVNARQLNGRFPSSGSQVADNPLRAWSHAGLFQAPVPESSLTGLPKLVNVADTRAPLEQRVRSYLDANCAQCHRPGGTRAGFDARFEVPLADQKLIGGTLTASDLGVPGARLVVPRDRSRSMLYLRMARRKDTFNMPPLASRRVDDAALEALARWIDGLADPRSSGRGGSGDGHRQLHP